jgi:chain length determinant protein (polysaccharide antigen chain regulator)
MQSTQNSQTAHAQYDDEIDLLELWNSLWSQKWLIGLIAGITTLGGISVAIFSTPVYKAETFFLPPLERDVEVLKYGNLQNLSAEAVYQRFLTNLQSRDLRRDFYQSNKIEAYLSENKPVSKPKALFEGGFNKLLALNIPKKGDASFTSLSLELRDAQRAADWLNAYAKLAAERTKEQLFSEVLTKIATETRSLTEKIASKRALAQSRREDRIAVLKEALVLAESVNLLKPMIDQAANNLSMEYMRGAVAIKAEIAILQARESDDPFISGMRDLQERLNYLQSIKFDENKLKVVRIDEPAVAPEAAIKPKKRLIVAVALVLGVMLGVFAALIRGAVRKRRGWVPEAI